jgi:hypothetical protein
MPVSRQLLRDGPASVADLRSGIPGPIATDCQVGHSTSAPFALAFAQSVGSRQAATPRTRPKRRDRENAPDRQQPGRP